MKKFNWHIIFFILFFLVSFSVLFFSWTSSPALSRVDWLPRWIGKWADKEENMNTRTAIPMFFWGIIACVTFGKSKSMSFAIFVSLIIGVLILLVAEGIQYYMPYRHADWGDIFWGSTGLLGGLIAFAFCKCLFKK